MITFVTWSTRPIKLYLRTLGGPITQLFRVCTYDALLRSRRRSPGTYCFADVERISDETRTRAAAVCDELVANGSRILNHPLRSMRRYDLLRMLRDRGTNQFGVWRAREQGGGYRFPVFVRGENDHAGSRTPLLYTPSELETALDRLRAAGQSDDNLVVEFLDTADRNGTYRKYGAFVIGDRVLARHLFVGDHWELKGADRVDDEILREEHEYLATNPHAAVVREIASAAGIDYGRIDYALLEGTVQVWEFNTNPVLTGRVRRRPEPSTRWQAVAEQVRVFARPVVHRLPFALAARKALVRIDRAPTQRSAIHEAFAAELRQAWTELAAG